MLNERRKHQRFPHGGVVWFGESAVTLASGTVADVARFGVAFTCAAENQRPQTGQRLFIKFALRQDAPQESHDGPVTNRIGRVCRVEELPDESCRIAVNLDLPLPGLD
jgi:hypothetical protein